MSRSQSTIQSFLNDIASYKFIRDDGILVLEPFCIYLIEALIADEVTEKIPYVSDIYFLLMDVMRETIGDQIYKHYITQESIRNWQSSHPVEFPKEEMTCIQISGLIQVSHIWISEIGHFLMEIAEPSNAEKYYHWVNENWTLTNAFITGYHNALFTFLKKEDKNRIREDGYSRFEALYLTQNKKCTLDEAVNILKSRHEAYLGALTKIQRAINEGYYLEAIVLQENLISNCIYNYLITKEQSINNETFSSLLQLILKVSTPLPELDKKLFAGVDAWRKKRNAAVHGFITTDSNRLFKSIEDFESRAETTSKEGANYCEQVIEWYEGKSVNFIEHVFPTERILN